MAVKYAGVVPGHISVVENGITRSYAFKAIGLYADVIFTASVMKFLMSETSLEGIMRKLQNATFVAFGKRESAWTLVDIEENAELGRDDSCFRFKYEDGVWSYSFDARKNLTGRNYTPEAWVLYQNRLSGRAMIPITDESIAHHMEYKFKNYQGMLAKAVTDMINSVKIGDGL